MSSLENPTAAAPADVDPVPEPDPAPLLPARMVNEFVYCPRLFYLEWVRGLWADNDDTAEGSDLHRRVDTPAGTAPEPGPGVRQIARALELSSETLGVTAKIDLVEFLDDAARPVDYKRGRPAPTPARVWEPEQVQLAIQALLLREAGYQCREGVIYFAETNERVTVPITPDLEARTRAVIAQARETAGQPAAPPPLVDSPKCPACALVSYCLPDELNLLLHRRAARPRTLITREPPARPLYLLGYGTQLRKDGNHFTVTTKDGETTRIRPIDISHVAAFGTVTISTSALHALLAQETPIAWLTRGGRFLGLTSGLMGKNIQLRRRQFTLTEAEALELARAFVIAKIRNQRTLLRRNSRWEINRTLELLADAVARARLAPNSDALRGIEGYAARLYFNAFPAMLRRDLPFTPGDLFRGRNRRPPRDPVNALLSFAYTLLTKDLAVQAQLIGFDPYWGFYHRPKFGRPALALDLAEEFRPLIADSIVITALNNGEITSAHFRRIGAGYTLTDDGRRTFLRIYERRLEQEITHPRFRYRLSYRRLLDLQPRFLAAVLLGELPAYHGFETR
ncbi:CRISPR-associated endonuclease Cas4g/Cas1g [Tepidiforma thermophila]|uniref:CRISPR-associated endonuclease Cas1 n=1 Tax=Tepidiforma thermophila (strain KCTC 52669 / CGMCC 1.13589 / G233) TaxID=2761530 RepID=A0A2A9HD59_TEPT2|nr:CRISPR-associated endonuclease Cas1 [Tepidiforma thermophila]PFG73082.1 CRISPR-associated protein Cas1 [Tepidiforma thermophila]